MSCGPEPVTFRLLDKDAGWSFDLEGTGITLGDTIELAATDPDAIDLDDLAGVMPPGWIARGCGPCEWYVASNCTPPALLRYAPRIRSAKDARTNERCKPPHEADPSCLGWITVAGGHCQTELLEPVAVTAARGRVAVLDIGRREILIVTPGGQRTVAVIPTTASGPIAFGGGALYIADRTAVSKIDLVTLATTPVATSPHPITRMVFAGKTLWVAVEPAPGIVHLKRLVAGKLEAAKLSDLRAVAAPTSLASATETGACLAISRGGGAPRIACIDRCGRPATPPAPSPRPTRSRFGELKTLVALDSGIPRCHWHRVQIDADIPERTAIKVALAVVETETERPPTSDWQTVVDARAVRDFLVAAQPPGRFLQLRIELTGDGFGTPVIRRIRVDFPRSTSATRLPGVYREDPIAADFLDRFIATFDASIEDLDRVIARFPALLDPETTPAPALAWIGAFFDIALDPAWSVATRRSILAAAPELYRRRGTPWALAEAVRLVTGVAPAIQELGSTTPFARLAKTRKQRGFRVGDGRLFGASRARLRLGSSALGAAPLRSYGDPDRDHLAVNAWRLLVQVPRSGDPTLGDRVRRLVDAQKPAHVVANVRIGGGLALVGVESAVGIDTLLGGLPLPRLGQNTRLRRASALARSSARGGAGFAVGVSSTVSIQTVLS